MAPPLFFLAPRNPPAHRALQFILTARPRLDLAHRYSHMIRSVGLALSRAVSHPPMLPRGSIRRSLIALLRPPFPSIKLSIARHGPASYPVYLQPSIKTAASPNWTSNLSRASRCGQTLLNVTRRCSRQIWTTVQVSINGLCVPTMVP
jgi:hypothetical protein